MRLTPNIRGLFGKLVRKGLTVTRIAELFDTPGRPCTDG